MSEILDRKFGVNVNMRKIRIAVALIAGAAAVSPSLTAQNTPKPSPYTGVSQPPPDDTITVDETAPSTSSTKLVARPETASSPAPSTTAATPSPSTVPAAAPDKSGKNWNPDFGIVGDTGPTDDAVSAPKRAAAADPDADIVTFVPARPGELPEGTIIRMAIDQELSTAESQPGSDFTGRVTQDVLSSGKVVIPQGSQVVGKVVHVAEGHRFGNSATIRLRPDVVVLPDGSRYVLRAQIVETSSKARVDSEGSLKPSSRLKTNVIKEGAGMGTGAVAGGLIGGPAGALVGTLIGAGVMTTNILVQHPATVTVPKDSTLMFSLTQPMSITPVESN